MAKSKMDEGETLNLIHYYGQKISTAQCGIGADASRSDIIAWACRVATLAKQMKGKNSLYLRDEE
jgi:hypothetical protein